MLHAQLEQQFHAAGEDTGAIVARAVHFFNVGDFANAGKIIARARARSPDDAYAAGVDAKVKLKTGKFIDALRLFGESLRLADPDSQPSAFVWAESLTFFFDIYHGKPEGTSKAVREQPAPAWWTKARLLQMSARAVETAEQETTIGGVFPHYFSSCMMMRATILSSGGIGRTTFTNHDDEMLWPSRAELREAVRVLLRGAVAARATGDASVEERQLGHARGLNERAGDPYYDAERDSAATALLPPQTHVVINGLASRPDLNGVSGRVLGWDGDSSRFMVEPDGGRAMKLRYACVTAAANPIAGLS